MANITTTTSKMFRLNWKDFLRGLLVAAIGGALASFMQGFYAGGIRGINWETVGNAAIYAGAGYLIKNFFTPGEIVMQNASDLAIQAVKTGEAQPVLMAIDPSEEKPLPDDIVTPK